MMREWQVMGFWGRCGCCSRREWPFLQVIPRPCTHAGARTRPRAIAGLSSGQAGMERADDGMKRALNGARLSGRSDQGKTLRRGATP